MGRFTEDMGRLRDEIESDRIARQTLIADTRQEVTDAAQAFISDLKNSVETLQADFREAHADMSEAARADRNAFLARLGGAVADIRISAASRQVAVREALAVSAAEARAERKQSAAALRDEVADLQDGFRRAHGAMAVEVRAAGQAFVADIVGAVADIQRQTVSLVNDFTVERSAGRQAWRGAAAPKPALAPSPVRAKAPVEPEPAKPAPKARHKTSAQAEAPVKAPEKPAEKPTEEVRPVGDESTSH